MRTAPLLLLFLSALIAISPLATDVYLPAMPAMAADLGTDIGQLGFTISTYFLGLSVGQLLGGSVSDQVGRKRCAVVGLALFCAVSILIMMSTSILYIQFLRVFQALGGGFASVVAMPMLRDVYPAREAARKIPVVMSVMMLAPMVAPALGSLILMIHWRAIFGFLSVYSLVLLLVYLFFIPETSKNPRQRLTLKNIGPNYWRVLCHKSDGRLIAVRYLLCNAFGTSVLMAFITNASFTYIEYFGVSAEQFPLLFGVNVVAAIFFNLLTLYLMKSVDPQRILKWVTVIHTILSIFLVLLVISGQAVFVAVVPLVVLIIGLGAVVSPCVSAMVHPYFRRLTGSVASLMAASVFLLGSMLGYLSGLFFDGSLLPLVLCMLIGSLMCVVLAHSIPFATLHSLAESKVSEGL